MKLAHHDSHVEWRKGAPLEIHMSEITTALTEKIQSLTAEQIVEVEDFVEFVRLRGQQRSLARAACAVSAPAFDAVWDNPEDAAYDAL